MIKIKKMTAYFFAIFISASAIAHAAEINSIDCQANYTANTTYRQLIREAAQNTFQGDEYQNFMDVVNEYPTKDSGDQKEFNASDYWTFKNKLSKVESYKFTDRRQTELGQRTVGSSAYLAGFDLHFALNGIVGIAAYRAKENYYKNGGF